MAAFEVSLTDAVSGAAKMASGSVDGLMSSLQQLGASALQGAQDGIDKLADGLAALGPEGEAAAEAIKVLTAVVFGAVEAMLAMGAAAISITQERDKLVSTFEALGKGAGSGKATVEMLDKLAAKLPFTTAQLGEMAKGFAAVGLQGKELEDAVSAVAAATALMGEKGGAAAEKMIKQLAEGGQAAEKMLKTIQGGGKGAQKLLADMGLNTHDLAQAMGMTDAQFGKAKLSAKQMQQAIEKALAKKGKGPLDDMALTFPAIAAKLKEGLMSLFEGLGPAVKPFMKAVKELFGNFSKGTPIMNGIKGVITKVFTVLFGWATKAVHAVSALIKWFSKSGGKGGFFEGVVGVLKGVWNALKTVAGTVGKALTPIIGFLKKIFTNATVLKGLKAIFKGIAIVIGVIVVVIAAVIAIFVLWYAVVAAAVAAVIGAIAGAVGAIVDFASGAIDALSGWASGAVDAAGNFISGLVNGIKSGAGAVVDAVKALASNALGAFKSILGIASPSKVMGQMGGHTTTGLADGIEAGTQDVADASKGMGAAVTEGASAGASKGKGGAAGGKGGGGITVTVEAGAIVIQGGGGDMLELTEEAITAIFERVALAQGLVT